MICKICFASIVAHLGILVQNPRVPRYRLGKAAEVLGVSVDSVRRLCDEGRLRSLRTKGGHRLVEGAALAKLASELAGSPASGSPRESARNHLPGIVTKVLRDRVAAQVEVQAGPHRIVSLLTREAADELRLAPGVLCVAVVKATNVVIELP